MDRASKLFSELKDGHFASVDDFSEPDDLIERYDDIVARLPRQVRNDGAGSDERGCTIDRHPKAGGEGEGLPVAVDDPKVGFAKNRVEVLI
jgi:hypothetical protein